MNLTTCFTDTDRYNVLPAIARPVARSPVQNCNRPYEKCCARATGSSLPTARHTEPVTTGGFFHAGDRRSTVTSLEADLERARSLPVADLADAIESIGFECTRCGACCTRTEDGEAHTATVFPDEVRELQAATDREWRDVARPMPYGLTAPTADSSGNDAGAPDAEVADPAGELEDRAPEREDEPTAREGETFEWALETDACGDCTFYEERAGVGACSVHEDRPLICRTYPFSVALEGTTQPLGAAVDREGLVRAHECEGLGRDISRDAAEDLARALKTRAIRELEEAIAVVERYEPASPGPGEVVVHDSEGAKRSDGTPLEERNG